MEKIVKIEAIDHYGDECLVDNVFKGPKHDRKPKGEVRIFEVTQDGKQKLVHKSNLVLYLGREMLAQRLVDTSNGSVTPTKDEFISWFGLGDGGVRPADPLIPVPPTSSDSDLSSPVMINDSTSTLYGDFHTIGGSYTKEGYYKKLFDSIEFETDALNDDRYLILKITTTIGTNDANGEQISEAGLFSAESRSGGYSGQFSLFARVTYPALIKTSERRLIFVWYLYV